MLKNKLKEKYPQHKNMLLRDQADAFKQIMEAASNIGYDTETLILTTAMYMFPAKDPQR